VKVLVTGGFGYLGGRLALGLAARGHQPVLAGRRVRESGTLGMACAALDVLAPVADLRAALRSHGVEAVVHLASLDEIEAVRDPELALRVSGEGTRRLIEAARAEGNARVVFFSTFHVYGRRFLPRIDEETPTKASHPYAIAHLAGEGFCREANETSGPRCVVFRMSNGYGAPADLSVERWTLAHNGFCREAVLDGRVTLATPGTQRRDLVWLDDVAQATDLALRAPPDALGEAVFNLGGDRVPTIFELATVVAERAGVLLGGDVPVVRPSEGQPTPAFTYAIDRLRALGYVPRDALVSETDALLERLRARGSP
jgi:UDP-glucose 4-epimerase